MIRIIGVKRNSKWISSSFFLVNSNIFRIVAGVIIIFFSLHLIGILNFNSIEEYGLDISKAVFCGGESPYRYVKAFDVNLFLSVNI